MECLSNQLQVQIQTPKTVKTVTRTIRMPLDVERELKEIASTEKVTVNALVNQALRKFVDWDYYAEKGGFAISPARQFLLLPARWEVFARLLRHASDKEAARLGRWAGRNVAREVTEFWFKEFSVRTALKCLELFTSRFARRFEYFHNITGNEEIVTIKHSMGRKWSIFHEQLVRTVFGELLGKKVKITQTNNQVVARIQK